ncbi:MAG: alanine--tRNA ligase [bacterium]
MKSAEIRSRFLNYFEKNGHKILDSAPLLPSDPELLFNIAGMVPFKPYFLAEEEPPSGRVTTSQKCIRTADIDNVGHTARHLTFFEMLGNFSFGDYFKQEAITLAWRFLTDELKLDTSRLWISVFGGDEDQGLMPDIDAEKLWIETAGVPEERVLRFGTSENFWAMGPTGPCGPCSEILYDQEKTDASPAEVKKLIEAGDDRILEFWNLVFMQFDRSEEGCLSPLPRQNIDTGLGLERLAAIMQGVSSNYETDLFKPLIAGVRQLSGVELDNEEKRAASRIIADHLRAACFLLSEGLMPGNEGRGYVLRRLIRRALRWGRKLGFEKPFMYKLVDEVIKIMGGHFEELKEKRGQIKSRLRSEEQQFNRTLDQGMSVLQQKINGLKDDGGETFSGEQVFKLYETYGFPVEITAEILEEEGIGFERSEVEAARRRHQEKSRSEKVAGEELDLDLSGLADTEFVGYRQMEIETTVAAIYKGKEAVEELKQGEEGLVILEKTPFYAEAGGQAGDRGKIGDFVVENTTLAGNIYLHHGRAQESISAGECVRAVIDKDRRRATMRHHTATHLLQAALRKFLGEEVMQSGSHVDSAHLRFDFNFDRRVTADELRRIEKQVNNWIYKEIEVRTEVKKKSEAREECALAFFGDHYGEEVRVVTVADRDCAVSKEFCGGTHVDNTGVIGPFKINDESSVSAGVRRIEASAGMVAYEQFSENRKLLEDLTAVCGVQRSTEIEKRFEQLSDELDKITAELEEYRRRESSRQARQLSEETRRVGKVNLLVRQFESQPMETLKQMIDSLREKLDTAVILFINKKADSAQLLLAVSKDISDQLNAGSLVNRLARLLGGGGGGRPEFAQAGGQDLSAIDRLEDELVTVIEEQDVQIAGN